MFIIAGHSERTWIIFNFNVPIPPQNIFIPNSIFSRLFLYKILTPSVYFSEYTLPWLDTFLTHLLIALMCDAMDLCTIGVNIFFLNLKLQSLVSFLSSALCLCTLSLRPVYFSCDFSMFLLLYSGTRWELRGNACQCHEIIYSSDLSNCFFNLSI